MNTSSTSVDSARKRLRTWISPETGTRRPLLEDLLAGAILALFVLVIVDPGLGVVAWFGIPLLLAGVVWLIAERTLQRRRS